MRLRFEVAARQLALSMGMYDPLTRLAAKYKSDKGITVFPFHAYSIHYAALFEKLRNKPIRIMEIGLARRTDRSSLGITCPSLSMWLDYFPNAQVYGLDIDDFSWVTLPRTRIFRADQGNVDDLLRVVAQCSKFDVIIDDGSHASYHQQVTLKTLFPSLAEGGYYVIEDLLWQPPDLEASLPQVRKTKELLKDRAALESHISGVKEVRFFDSAIQKGKESMALIVKA
jgi:hypothetical protein